MYNTVNAAYRTDRVIGEAFLTFDSEGRACACLNLDCMSNIPKVGEQVRIAYYSVKERIIGTIRSIRPANNGTRVMVKLTKVPTFISAKAWNIASI